MRLSVTPYPGSEATQLVVSSKRKARYVMNAMLMKGCHFYAEPQGMGAWSFKVDFEHDLVLRQFVAKAEQLK